MSDNIYFAVKAKNSADAIDAINFILLGCDTQLTALIMMDNDILVNIDAMLHLMQINIALARDMLLNDINIKGVNHVN